jgi:hypothetical protein
MANRTVESAGVRRNFTFNKDGTEYRVFETNPKRTQDLFRFELWKDHAETPYVVSFQEQDGSRGACSCPAGKFHRAHGECKHIKMCRVEFMSASRAANPQRPTSKALTSGSKWDSEIATLESKVRNLRTAYAQKKAEVERATNELAEIEREGKLAKDRLNTLKDRVDSAVA